MLKLSCAQSDIQEDAMNTIERYSMTGPAHAQTLTGPVKNVCKEDQCEADPTYQGSFGTAGEESNLPRRSRVGPVC